MNFDCKYYKKEGAQSFAVSSRICIGSTCTVQQIMHGVLCAALALECGPEYVPIFREFKRCNGPEIMQHDTMGCKQETVIS